MNSTAPADWANLNLRKQTSDDKLLMLHSNTWKNFTVRKQRIYRIELFVFDWNTVGDLSRQWPEGSLFDSYYTKV